MDDKPSDNARETCFVQLDGHGASSPLGDRIRGEQDEIKVAGSPSRDTVTPSRHCVTFHDVTYEVPQRKRCVRQPNKVILNAVSGMMLSGLNAIMGPTGSGKTTLLDILADRKDKKGVSGEVLINGRRKPHNFKCLVGYVVQDDVVMGTLTVRENLHFSAALRLPSHMTRQQRKERVERVIDELKLQQCANSKIGTEFIRGVSGGERKRTNIGMELIIEPQVLFLDEPTTGLDAYTAVSVVKLLKNLSRVNNRVVIMSIHQPRYSIFKLFDTLSLLSRGSIAYHGMAQKALQYFDDQGLVCEEHENPADFFLDTILKCEHGDTSDDEDEDTHHDSIDLAEKYLQSQQHKELRSAIDPIHGALLEEEKTTGVTEKLSRRQRRSISYPRNFFWQLLVLAIRGVVNLLRSPMATVLQLIVMLVFGLIIGGLYFDRSTGSHGFDDRIGVFFFIAINQAFGSLSAIDIFIEQRALFIHENASGYYRVSAFFLAKVLIDVIPLRFLPNLVFALVTYFMVGFQLEVERFFIYYLLLNLVSIAAVSIAFSISAAIRVGAVANLLIAIVFVVSMLFGGLLISLDSLPGWIEWAKYLSFIRYAVEAMTINEIDGLEFDAPCILPQSENNTKCDGLELLEFLGYETGWLWYDVLALILFTIVFLILAYTILRLIKKEK